MTKLVPIFVAVVVWLVRVLIIGTFSIAGERLFTVGEAKPYEHLVSSPRPQARPVAAASYTRPANISDTRPQRPVNNTEPTYHPVGISAQGRNENNSPRS